MGKGASNGVFLAVTYKPKKLFYFDCGSTVLKSFIRNYWLRVRVVRVIWSITQVEEGLIKPYKIWKNAFNIIFTNERTVIKRQQSSAVPYQLTRWILQHKHSPLKLNINGKILETKLDEKTWTISKSGRQINRLCCVYMHTVAFYKPFGLPCAWTFLKTGSKV